MSSWVQTSVEYWVSFLDNFCSLSTYSLSQDHLPIILDTIDDQILLPDELRSNAKLAEVALRNLSFDTNRPVAVVRLFPFWGLWVSLLVVNHLFQMHRVPVGCEANTMR
jgi:hypothetical protein